MTRWFSPEGERAWRALVVDRLQAARFGAPAWVLCPRDGARRALERRPGRAGRRLRALRQRRRARAHALDARLGLGFARSPTEHDRAGAIEQLPRVARRGALGRRRGGHVSHGPGVAPGDRSAARAPLGRTRRSLVATVAHARRRDACGVPRRAPRRSASWSSRPRCSPPRRSTRSRACAGCSPRSRARARPWAGSSRSTASTASRRWSATCSSRCAARRRGVRRAVGPGVAARATH